MAAVPNSYGKRYGHISRVQKILTESTATRTELAVAQKQQEEFHVKEALLRRQQNAYHDQGHIKEMEEELEQKLRTIPSVSQRQSDCERLHSTASETFTRLAGISHNQDNQYWKTRTASVEEKLRLKEEELGCWQERVSKLETSLDEITAKCDSLSVDLETQAASHAESWEKLEDTHDIALSDLKTVHARETQLKAMEYQEELKKIRKTHSESIEGIRAVMSSLRSSVCAIEARTSELHEAHEAEHSAVRDLKARDESREDQLKMALADLHLRDTEVSKLQGAVDDKGMEMAAMALHHEEELAETKAQHARELQLGRRFVASVSRGKLRLLKKHINLTNEHQVTSDILSQSINQHQLAISSMEQTHTASLSRLDDRNQQLTSNLVVFIQLFLMLKAANVGLTLSCQQSRARETRQQTLRQHAEEHSQGVSTELEELRMTHRDVKQELEEFGRTNSTLKKAVDSIDGLWEQLQACKDFAIVGLGSFDVPDKVGYIIHLLHDLRYAHQTLHGIVGDDTKMVTGVEDSSSVWLAITPQNVGSLVEAVKELRIKHDHLRNELTRAQTAERQVAETNAELKEESESLRGKLSNEQNTVTHLREVGRKKEEESNAAAKRYEELEGRLREEVGRRIYFQSTSWAEGLESDSNGE